MVVEFTGTYSQLKNEALSRHGVFSSACIISRSLRRGKACRQGYTCFNHHICLKGSKDDLMEKLGGCTSLETISLFIKIMSSVHVLLAPAAPPHQAHVLLCRIECNAKSLAHSPKRGLHRRHTSVAVAVAVDVMALRPGTSNPTCMTHLVCQMSSLLVYRAMLRRPHHVFIARGRTFSYLTLSF